MFMGSIESYKQIFLEANKMNHYAVAYFDPMAGCIELTLIEARDMYHAQLLFLDLNESDYPTEKHITLMLEGADAHISVLEL